MDPEPEPLLSILGFLQHFDAQLIWPMLGVVVLLFFSGLVSGSEVAFFALTPTDYDDLKNSSEERDQVLLKLLEAPDKLLATILINNNFINIALILLSGYLTNELINFTDFPILGFIIEVVIITFLLLLFGEVLPKVYATSDRLKFARLMAKPTYLTLNFWRPLNFVLIRSSGLLKFPVRNSKEISVDDLGEAIRMAEDGQGSEEEQKILEGILKFGNTNVKQVMRPRTDVVALDSTTPYREVLKVVRDSGYSRLPVYEGNFDQVLGILYIKDLLSYIKEDDDFDWMKLLRDPFFVPENKKIDDLLVEFKAKKIHLAIVVDEYGGTSGITTLEDILEEIVGEISDEFDEDELVYSKLDDYNYTFEGKTPLNDFYKVIGIEGDEFEAAKGEADTLAGFVLEIAGKFPSKNEEFQFNGFVFKIELLLKRRIQRLKITIPKTNENESDAA
ncbi:MAG: gliding motility-associated protein GldE [Schleiferiaceae bacterium]|nr:gliding motility-associated protein GldE [Schleiferiaceae bacterium]